LMARCAGNVKKLSLELGGNAPFIVFDDPDLEAAADGAMLCTFRNPGQTCVCAHRIYVQAGAYEKSAAALAERAAALTVGAGFTAGVAQGPLIDEPALAKVAEHVPDATGRGAPLLTGGARHELGGTFYQPTVLGGVTSDMKIAGEETFGPVAPLFRFRDEGEALAMANDTPFGLAAYFYSRALGRVWRVAEGLESGIVGINTGIISTEVAPFGGVKESGIGREGSRLGLDEFLEVKYLCMGIGG